VIPLHALIIDDDRMNAIVLEKLLENEGLTSSVIDHPAGLQNILAEMTALHVVFVDLELPSNDGYEVLAFLRTQLGTNVPIVAYTVHISESVTARQKGFDGFLGKPINRQDFPSNLRRILNGERVWAV